MCVVSVTVSVPSSTGAQCPVLASWGGPQPVLWPVLSGDECGEEVGALHLQRPTAHWYSGIYIILTHIQWSGLCALTPCAEALSPSLSVWSEASSASLPLPVLARGGCARLVSDPPRLPQRSAEELCHSQHQIPHHCTLQVSTRNTQHCTLQVSTHNTQHCTLQVSTRNTQHCTLQVSTYNTHCRSSSTHNTRSTHSRC